MFRGSMDHSFRRGLSLRAKSFLIFGLLMVVVLAAFLFTVSTFLLGTFGMLQDELAFQRIDRTVRELDQMLQQQRSIVFDHAVWDETYDFLNGRNPEFLTRNYDPKNVADGLGTSGQDAVILVNSQKNPVAWIFIDEAFKASYEPPLYFDMEVLRQGTLLQERAVGSALVASPNGITLLSAYPVAHTDGAGPSPGWLVFGINIDDRWFEEMRHASDVVVSLSYPSKLVADATMEQGETLETETLGTCRVYYPHGHRPGVEGITAYVAFEDSLGRIPAELKLVIPSTVFSTAVALRDQIVWMSLVGGLLVIISGLLAIEALFIRRIKRIDSEFSKLAGDESFSAHLLPGSSDEFGNLAMSANLLLESLRRRRAESRVQEQLFSSVIETASEGIMAFRALRNENGDVCDFIVVLANKTASEIVNHSQGDIVGKCLLGLLPGNLADRLFDRYVRVVETKLPEHFEIYFSSEQRRSWYSISAEPWTDGLVATFEEISARKRVEQELKANIEEMERFNNAMLGREYRILEVKTEVNRLRARLGMPPTYQVDMAKDDF